MVHLVYCDDAGRKGERTLDRILSGQKTMVVRGAAGRKIPHSRVFQGETLYFMEKGTGEISAQACVVNVQNLVKLTDEQIDAAFAENRAKLALTEKQEMRWHKKCLCLVEFAQVAPITPPLAFDKQSNMDDWIILEKIEDAVIGTSIPYSYDNTRF